MPIESRRLAGFASLALLTVLLIGTRAAPGAEANQHAQPAAQLNDSALVESGRQRFNQACSYCHGKEGAGGKTKSFKGRHDLEGSAVFDTIANGRKRGANIMPPWKNSLSDAQIWELVAYILSLSDAPANE